MSNTRHLQAALYYAQRLHWHVFPVHSPIFDESGRCIGCTCESYRRSDQCAQQHPYLYLGAAGHCNNPGKCPRVRWGERSTIDPTQICRWWHGWPNANIGVDCDKSGLLVFDADSYKQVGDVADLLSWADRETVTVITQGGGEHYIYDRQGKPYGNSCRNLPPGVDIRGVGGYIVAVPSLGATGRRYVYEHDYGPHEVDPLPIPKALDDILSDAQPRGRRSPNGVTQHPARIACSVRLVEDVLARADLDHSGVLPYGDGRRWLLHSCPFNPTDDEHPQDLASFVVVLDDGRIAAGCHHNRCRKHLEEMNISGWTYLRRLAGMERRRVLVEVPE